METMTTENIVDEACRIWRLRLSQRNEQAIRQYLGLKHKCSDKYFMLPSSCGKDFQDIDAFSHVLAIRCSMSRVIGHKKEQLACLDDLKRYYSSAQNSGIPLPFIVYFEIGVSLFANTRYSDALEYFYLAEEKSCDDFERSCALINAVSCLDQIGLGYAENWQKLAKLMKNKSVEFPPAVISQFNSMQLRLAFRDGELREYLADCDSSDGVEKNENSSMLQSTYLLQWIFSLPYLSSASTAQEKFISDLLKKPVSKDGLLYNNFRSYTLAGVMHGIDDIDSVKKSEIIDRLYLWVWKWLVDPDNFPLPRVLGVLTCLNLSGLEDGITSEDTFLLENALLWLSLFDGNSYENIQSKLSKVTSRKSESRVLAFESMVIRYLVALKNNEVSLADDLLDSLKKMELWGSEEVRLWQIVSGFNDSSVSHAGFEKLISNLKTQIEALRNPEATIVVVDLRQHLLHNKDQGFSIFSEEMATFIKIMKNSGFVTDEDMVKKCFGISNYDYLIHGPKISQLLFKIRPIFKGIIDFRFRNGKVTSAGRWEKVQVVSESNIEKLLRSSSDWQDFQNDKLKRSNNLVSQLENELYIDRNKIEKMTGKSRATVNRMISKFEDRGMLTRKGSARSTKYLMSDSFKDMISKGEIRI